MINSVSAFRPKTTVQDPERSPAPNRLAKRESPSRSGEIFVSDITYVATREGWLYLAAIMDLFSRRIAGWHLGESMETDLVIQAAFSPGCVFDTRREARLTIFGYIETFYNREHIHTSLGNQSPDNFLTNHFNLKQIHLNKNQSDQERRVHFFGGSSKLREGDQA